MKGLEGKAAKAIVLTNKTKLSTDIQFTITTYPMYIMKLSNPLE
jgi:hypothetical protein